MQKLIKLIDASQSFLAMQQIRMHNWGVMNVEDH